jgi:hypothetical protein
MRRNEESKYKEMEHASRTDRSPSKRNASASRTQKSEINGLERTISSSDSPFSLGASTAAAPAVAAGAPPTAGAAAPPAPTLERRSFTFFPSNALARRVAQIGSTSTDAAEVM